MVENKNEHVVIAIFDNEGAATQAIDAMKRWDAASDDMKLGAVGTITKEGDQVKTHVGHKTGKGAVVGVVLGIIAAVLSGGIGLLGGIVGGGVLGGVVGRFLKQSVNLTQEEIEQIGNELDAGRVAVVVACDEYEIEWVTTELTEGGGTVRTYAVPADALDEAAEALKTASPDEPENPPVMPVP